MLPRKTPAISVNDVSDKARHSGKKVVDDVTKRRSVSTSSVDDTSSLTHQQNTQHRRRMTVFASPQKRTTNSISGFDEKNSVVQKQKRNREAAVKAWALIRSKLEEVRLSRRDISFNWKFLQQHIANMTAKENAKTALYDKYLHGPADWWAQGLTNYPQHLFVRHNNRPRSIRSSTRPHCRTGTLATEVKRNAKTYNYHIGKQH